MTRNNPNDPGKLSKAEAGYADVSRYPAKIKSCGICDHFYRGSLGGMCQLVRGKIAPGGVCWYFSPEVVPGDVLPMFREKGVSAK